MKLSAVICTHNPRQDYLLRTLNSLRAQIMDQKDWELIIIDNQSSNPVSETANISWHHKGRIVVESELGLTPARIRGLAEAGGEIIVFVDDDNVIAPDYLDQVLEIFRTFPKIGCIGAGVLSPEFESEPIPMTRPYLSYLALREVNRDYWSNQSSGMIPWGAGLAIRSAIKSLYVESMNSNILGKTLDRKGASLISGGDDEFSHVAVKNGWGIGIFVSLRITHLIDSARLTIEYLERLMIANGKTRALLAHLHNEAISPLRPASPRQLLQLVGQVPLRDFLKCAYAYANLLNSSRFDRRMAHLQFEGWFTGMRELKAKI
jgi:glycosyltransferase involved in cell wall biosynthesis